jgi:uncharacterized membrane protein (DUF485 family)
MLLGSSIRMAVPIDWEAIERSPEFRALVTSRRRFTLFAGGGAIGLTVAYVLVAYLAPDVMAADVVAPITLGYVGVVVPRLP